MDRIVIFTDDPGWHGKQLSDAFGRLGYSSCYLSLTECQLVITNANLPISLPDFLDHMPAAVFVRGIPGGSLEEVVFYLDILHGLALLDVPMSNSGRAIERSVDKAMTSLILSRAGIATPPTWVVRNKDTAMAITEQELKSGHWIITKPLFGSQGEGIRRFEKISDLIWLASSRGIYYLQRFIHCSGTNYSDYRVFVIGHQAIAIMRRYGKSWLNNVSRGATCEAVKHSSVLASLACQAVQALNMDYAGVDIIQDHAGQYWVIEVNSIPAWKGLQSVVSVCIADLLAQHLVNKIDKVSSC